MSVIVNTSTSDWPKGWREGGGNRSCPFPLVWQIDTNGYTTATVDELIDKTRQAIMANFNPEYVP